MIKRFAILFCIFQFGAGAVFGSGAIDYSGLQALFGEPVTTSATGKPQRLSETPVSLEIITAEEIRRSGALDIAQILRRFAGVEVARNFKGHADVNIRGFNQPMSNRLLVLIDGRQVYMDNFGLTLWHSLPVQLSEIRQIEIVRGPNTSLFGFNAASGVINIVTLNPLADDENIVEGRIGNQSHGEVSTVLTLRTGKQSAVRLSGGGLDSDGYSRRTIPGPFSKERAIKKGAFHADGMIALDDRSHLQLGFGINEFDGDILAVYHRPTDLKSITRHYVAKFTRDTNRTGLWTVHAYRNELDANFGQVGTTRDRLHTLQLNNLLMRGADHTFRFGAEFRDNRITGDPFGTNDPEFVMNIGSLSAMWDWQIGDTVTATHALRIDRWWTDRDGGLATNNSFIPLSPRDFDRQETEWSANIGWVYRMNADTTCRVSVARGLHVPSMAELARNSQFPAVEFYGNPHLDTEVNETVEFGFVHRFGRNSSTLSVNVFHERIRDVIQPVIRTLGAFGGTGGAEADFSFANVGDASASGLEISAKGRLTGSAIDWQAGYTYIEVDDDPDGAPDHFLDFERTQAQHQFSLALNRSGDQWDLGCDVHVVSDTPYRGTVGHPVVSRASAAIDTYVLLNVHVGRRIGNATFLSVDGFNIVDDHHERPVLFAPNGLAGGNRLSHTVLFSIRHNF